MTPFRFACLLVAYPDAANLYELRDGLYQPKTAHCLPKNEGRP